MRFITTIKQYSLHGDILCKVAEATSQQSAPPEKNEKKDKKKVNPLEPCIVKALTADW